MGTATNPQQARDDRARSMESTMFAMSLKADSEPSYFYLVMAKSCFRRAVVTSHPHGRGALREIGHDYLAKALPSRDQKGDVAFRR
jgi:hypothetical protein